MLSFLLLIRFLNESVYAFASVLKIGKYFPHNCFEYILWVILKIFHLSKIYAFNVLLLDPENCEISITQKAILSRSHYWSYKRTIKILAENTETVNNIFSFIVTYIKHLTRIVIEQSICFLMSCWKMSNNEQWGWMDEWWMACYRYTI